MDNIKTLSNNSDNINHIIPNVYNITNKFILDIYNNEWDIINMFIEVILNDYNNYTNNDIEIPTMIFYSNKLLLVYISNINLDFIDNHKKAYEFMMLSTVVSFWILYKYITNDNYINSILLESYIYYTPSEILKKEIDILISIDYNIYKIFINIDEFL